MVPGKRKYVIWGGVGITLVYMLYNIFFVYAGYYNEIPRHLRHINKLLSILIVYGTGWYSLKKYNVKWLSGFWKITYVTLVVLLILIGMYDWSFGPAPLAVRDVAKTLHECLISPVLYAAVIIVNNTLQKTSGNGMVPGKGTVQF